MKRFLRWLFRKLLGEPHFLVLVGALVLFGARADAQGCFGPGCGGSSSGGGVTPATLNDATYCPDLGVSDAYVCSMVSAPSSYAAGMLVTLSANTANTGTASVNVNSLGVKTIVRSDGTTLQTGDITAAMIVSLVYDGTNFRAVFRSGTIISPAGGVTIRSDTYASGSDVGLTVQCSLTGNCYEVKNSAGTAIFSFSSGANLVWPSGSPSLQANDAAGIFTIRVGGATNNNALVLDANSGDTKLSSYAQKNRYTLSYAASSTSAINSSHIFDTSPGNTSAGFGVGLLARGQSSTTASQDMALFGGVWTTATHASRTSKAVAQTVNNAGSLTTTWDAQNGHDRTVGTAPAVSACGTSPSAVTGSDGNGRFTVGSTGTVTSCTLTFAIAYNVAPACIANNETALELVRAVATTTTLTLSATDMTTDVLTYICRGN